MFDPHDDTDVPSGSTDGAQMESTSSPVPRLQGAAGNMYSARRPGAWDGRLDCSAPAILLRAKKSEVLLTAQISE